MLSNRIQRLAPPPRSVPLTVVCSAMFGTTGGFGAAFMLFGLVFTLIFTHGYRPIDNLRLAFAKDTARGIVTGVSETNSTENDVEVYEYDFSFTTRKEQKVTGTSYSTGRRWFVEETVTVEYLPEDPSVARIQGSRISVFSPLVLFVLIFPAVGAAMFFSAAVGGLRQVFLLRNGLVADARITSTRGTGVTVNGNPVMNYAYEIRTREGAIVDGAAKAFAYDTIGDEEIEPALYLPDNPAFSTLVDAISLHHPLEIDETTGRWVSSGGKLQALLYLLAWAATIVLGGYGLLSGLGVIR